MKGEEMSSSTVVCGVVVWGSGGGADTLCPGAW